MTSEEVLALFKELGGLLEGHFLYASGRHGRQFLQASRVFQHPRHASRLCMALSNRFGGEDVELVAGPAVGGIIPAYETARQLNCRAVFTEKDAEGQPVLKRGFALKPGTRTLVVEDIVTTGGSVRKAAEHLQQRGAEIVGIGCLIDRNGGQTDFGPIPYRYLSSIEMESWEPHDCPLCREDQPLTDPDDLVVDDA
ncbi:MAG: orotate phosphoribosyltransferase [Candidatus Hydrogenedentota bacterium]